MRCNDCGSENKYDARFCRKCGAPLASRSPKRGLRGIWIVVVTMFTLILIGVGFGVYLFLIRGDGIHDENGDPATQKSLFVLEESRELLRDEADGRDLIALHADDLGVANVGDMLGQCDVDRSSDNTFYSYSLEYNGIPLFGRRVVLVANRDGMLDVISSGAINMDDCQTVPTISDTEAYEVLKRETGASNAYLSELVFYATNESEPELAYHLSFIDGADARSIFVSAADGSVLGRTDDVHTIQGKGQDINGTDRPLELASRLEVSDKGEEIPVTNQGFFVLADLQRNIYVYDAGGATREKVIIPMELKTSKGTKCNLLPSKSGKGYDWQDSQGNEFELMGQHGVANSWMLKNKSNGSKERVEDARYNYADHLVMSTTNEIDAPSAVTLMSRLANVYDFYASDETFSRKGFDGAGGRVNAVCNVDDNNAFAWTPAGSYAQVCCGIGNTYLDQLVVAHEFSHAIQGSICTLDGIGESGSIQEGTADILGILACDYADNKKMDNSAKWSCLPFRDPSNPESVADNVHNGMPFPSSYEQDGCWADTSPESDDNGGAHHNSTVLSHAAYLMCSSGSEMGGRALTTAEMGSLVLSAFRLVSKESCTYAEYAGYINFMARELLDDDKCLRVKKSFEAVKIEPWLVAYVKPKTDTSNDSAYSDNDDPTSQSPSDGSQAEHERVEVDREVSLVLDISGSMEGEPLDLTKRASEEFFDTITENNARCGLVTYNSSASLESQPTRDVDRLREAVNQLRASGGTNTDEGLIEGATSLSAGELNDQRILVIMSDGEANQGRTGDDLISAAEALRDDGITIYSVGVFSDDVSDRAEAQRVMGGIASEGCHYEVASMDDLEDFFGDIADQISGKRFIYLRVACPVNVEVSYGGETLSSSRSGKRDRTSFGTVTYEDIEDSDDQVKIVRLAEGPAYDVRIEGYGRGSMSFTVGLSDEDGAYSDMRSFDLPVTSEFTALTTLERADSTTMRVDADGDGTYEKVLRAEAHGHAREVDNSEDVRRTLAVCGILAAVFVLAMVVTIAFLSSRLARRGSRSRD